MERVVFEKSKNFALRIIALYKYFCDEKREFILSKQLLRSGTSIGANIAEANCACSRKDFLAKMHIAFKVSDSDAIRFHKRRLRRTSKTLIKYHQKPKRKLLTPNC